MNTPSEKRVAPKYWNVVIHSVISYLGQSLMQVVDLIFCRNLGSHASATIGTCTSLLAWFIIVGIGLISSLEFLIPNALGSGDEKKANEYFYSGTFVVLLLSVVSTVCLLLLSYLAPLYGMNPEIIPSVQSFCLITCTSYLPVFLIPLFRVELQARGRPDDTTYAFIMGNLLNVFLNWVLVLGHLGFPALGLTGSAWANVISRYAIFLYLLYRLIKIRSSHDHLHLDLKTIQLRARTLDILKKGVPTSLHMLFEIGAFIFVGMLASRLSSAENAAHAIALSIASFAFMVPAGMGSAAALTISRALGERNLQLGRDLGHLTLRVGTIYAIIGSLVFWIFRIPLVNLYTSDPDAIRIGVGLLMVAAVFQFGDAMQVILAGCLRGYGETKIQAQMNAIGHWVIGIPLGVLLCYRFNMGITGLWIGLCAGLFSVAILLFLRYRTLTINEFHRTLN